MALLDNAGTIPHILGHSTQEVQTTTSSPGFGLVFSESSTFKPPLKTRPIASFDQGARRTQTRLG